LLAIAKACSNNAYDTDRTFPIFLGELGTIAYNTKVSAVVRTHPEQDSIPPVYHEVGVSFKAITIELLATSFPSAVRDSALLFNQVLVPGLNDQELEGMMAYLPWEQKKCSVFDLWISWSTRTATYRSWFSTKAQNRSSFIVTTCYI